MSWFQLTPFGNLMSIGGCATEGCYGSAEWRLEADGVGSNYCGNCHAKIVAEASPRQEREALARLIYETELPYPAAVGWEHTTQKVRNMYLRQADRILAASYVTPEAHAAALREAWEAGRDAVIEMAKNRHGAFDGQPPDYFATGWNNAIEIVVSDASALTPARTEGRRPMSDLPERVWLDNSALEPAIKHAWRAGWWQGQASKLHTHEYVRADALAASQAEAERLREALTATLTASQPQGGE